MRAFCKLELNWVEVEKKNNKSKSSFELKQLLYSPVKLNQIDSF